MPEGLEHRLRRALREHASGISPPADPVADVRRRARRQDRRARGVVGVACVAAVVLLGTVLLPRLHAPSHVVQPVAPDREEAGAGLANICHNRAGGFRIRYPEGWHTNARDATYPFDNEPVAACRYFHPEPFTVGEVFSGEEAGGDKLAVGVAVSQLPADEYRPYNPGVDHVTVDDVTVDGFPAVRIDAVAGDYAAHPEGHPPPWQRLRAHVIDTGDRRVIVTTSTQVRDLAFRKAAAVHERMVDSLEIADDPAASPGES